MYGALISHSWLIYNKTPLCDIQTHLSYLQYFFVHDKQFLCSSFDNSWVSTKMKIAEMENVFNTCILPKLFVPWREINVNSCRLYATDANAVDKYYRTFYMWQNHWNSKWIKDEVFKKIKFILWCILSEEFGSWKED